VEQLFYPKTKPPDKGNAFLPSPPLRLRKGL